jgi:tight adherence protein C
MFLYGLIISICIAAIVALAYFLLETSKHTYFLQKRLMRAVSTGGKVAPEVANRSHLTEVLSKKTETLVNRFIPHNVVSNLERRVAIAKIKNFTTAQYFLLKAILVAFILVFFPIFALALGLKLNQGIMALLVVLAFFFPDMMLNSSIAKKHKQIIKELPNFIDLLRVCIEAGMDLESGLNKVVDKSQGLLRDEAKQTTTEIRMGKPLAEALQDLSSRIDLDDFSAFITLVIQSNQMGISIANVLKAQSYQVNLKYIQNLRARAAKIPILILIPMVFFILPALLVVIIGPAIIQILSAFQ